MTQASGSGSTDPVPSNFNGVSSVSYAGQGRVQARSRDVDGNGQFQTDRSRAPRQGSLNSNQGEWSAANTTGGIMSSASCVHALTLTREASLQEQTDLAIDDLLTSFPAPHRLSADERRGMIARYTAVLEGNFVYWMTGAYLAVRSEDAREIILENLHEEVRDAHPAMLRRFAIAAQAVPTDSDAAAVNRDLTEVRLFIGRLSGVRI